MGRGAAQAGGEPFRPQPACSAAVLGNDRGDAENTGLDLVGVFLTEFLGDSFANVVVADLDRRRAAGQHAGVLPAALPRRPGSHADAMGAHVHGRQPRRRNVVRRR